MCLLNLQVGLTTTTHLASRHGSISKSVSKELPSTEAPASPSAPTKASSTSQTSVKHLCLIGSAVSNVLELTTDKSKDG